MNKPQKTEGKMLSLEAESLCLQILLAQYRTFNFRLGRLRVWITWEKR